MTEEQKRILENIHKETEDLMIEKATLTLIARKNALEGKNDNQILEQIQQLDAQILKFYREEINKIKQYAKDLRTLAKQEYGDKRVSEDKQYISYGPENDSFDLQASFAAHKLYGDTTKIDPNDIELYNNLLEEMTPIAEEERKLLDHANRKKLGNTELEKNFRASIKNMSKIISKLQRKLGMEVLIVANDIENKTIQRAKFIRDMDQKIKNAHGKEDKKAELEREKNEGAKARLEEIIELRRHLSVIKTEYEESLKSQYQMDKEAHDRKEQMKQQINEQKERKKAVRREANEARREANEEKKQENKEPKQQEKKPQQIKAISKPKNKMSLKEKLKRVAVAAVAAVVTLATGMGIVKGKSENKTQTQSSPTMVAEQTIDDQTSSNTITDKTAKNPTEVQDVATQKQATSTPQQNIQNIDEVEYTEAVGLWSTVKIGDKIYSTMENAVNGQNEKTPYFKSNQEYTVVGVKYSNGTDSTIITTTQENCNELEETLKSQGFKPEGYMITTEHKNDVLTNINKLKDKITGFVSVEDIVKQANMEQGRGR